VGRNPTSAHAHEFMLEEIYTIIIDNEKRRGLFYYRLLSSFQGTIQATEHPVHGCPHAWAYNHGIKYMHMAMDNQRKLSTI